MNFLKDITKIDPLKYVLGYIKGFVAGMGDSLFFLFDVISCIVRGKVRIAEVLKQIYEQGIQSIVIIALTSFATGAVLAFLGDVVLSRFDAREYIAYLVALALVRELSPVLTSVIFSGKAGARITAELGSMNVNDQILATRTLGVDPIEFLIVPRIVACFFVIPILVVFSEIIGIIGGFFIGVFECNILSSFYINRTIDSIGYVDFFSGFAKTFFFAIIIAWICCYQGFNTKGGSLGVGKHTTKAVALCYIVIIISNTFLTKFILTLWG